MQYISIEVCIIYAIRVYILLRACLPNSNKVDDSNMGRQGKIFFRNVCGLCKLIWDSISSHVRSIQVFTLNVIRCGLNVKYELYFILFYTEQTTSR